MSNDTHPHTHTTTHNHTQTHTHSHTNTHPLTKKNIKCFKVKKQKVIQSLIMTNVYENPSKNAYHT